jgi:putative tricarboxylic transport membrane protein
MKNGDRFSALFFLVFSLAVCWKAVDIGMGSLHQPGPGLAIFGAGASLGILSLWVLVRSFMSKQVDAHSQEIRSLKKRIFLLVCVSLFIYALAAPWLGFPVSTFLFSLFILRLIKLQPWWQTLLTAALITIGNYLLFVTWLGLSLPKGIFN